MIAHGDIQPVSRADAQVHYIAQHYWLEEEERRFAENYELKEADRRRELQEAVEAAALRAMLAQRDVLPVTEPGTEIKTHYDAEAEHMYANAAPFRRMNDGAGQHVKENTGSEHLLPSSWFAPRAPDSNGISVAAPDHIILQENPSTPQEPVVGKLFGGKRHGGKRPANPSQLLRKAATQPKSVSIIDSSAQRLATVQGQPDVPSKKRRRKRVARPVAGTQDATAEEVAAREAAAATIAAAEREAALAAAELEAEIAATERKAKKETAAKRAAEERAAEERAAATRAAAERAAAERAAMERAAEERAAAERAAAARAVDERAAAERAAAERAAAERAAAEQKAEREAAERAEAEIRAAAAEKQTSANEAKSALLEGSSVTVEGSSSPTPGSPRGEDNLLRRRASDELGAEKAPLPSPNMTAEPSSPHPGSPRGGQDNIFRQRASGELRMQRGAAHADADDEDPMARKASVIQGPARGMRLGSLMTVRPPSFVKGQSASRSGDLGGLTHSHSVSAAVDADDEDSDPMAREISMVQGPRRGMRLGSLIVPPRKAPKGAKAATPADLDEESAVAVHFQEIDLKPPKGMRLRSIFVPPRRGAGNVSASADVDEQSLSPRYGQTHQIDAGMRLGGTVRNFFAEPPKMKTKKAMKLSSIGEDEGLE